MDIEVINHTQNVDWNEVPLLLEKVGMAFHSPEKHKEAFENSRAVIFLYNDSKLIGTGRAISDGVAQAALYDVAVHPDYQGYHLGTKIVKSLMDRLPGCNFILYASPGKEPFYRKLGFRWMKTGMACFVKADTMQQRGFTD